MKAAKFYLRKRDKQGYSTIYLFVNVNGKQLYYSTSCKIKDEEWSKAKQKAKRNEELNEQLYTYAAIGEKFIAESAPGAIYTNENLKNFIVNKLKVNKPTIPVKANHQPKTAKVEELASPFFQVINQFINTAHNRLNANGERISSKRVDMYRNEKKVLKEFEKAYKQKLTFETFDKTTIAAFQTYLTNNKKLANNTIVRYIRLLFVFFRYAEDYCNVNVNQSFRKYQTHNNKKDSVVLNEKEIQRIWDYVPVNECEANTKKMFLIGLFTGLRFSDYSQLNPKNINFNDMTISLIQTKTGQRVVLPLHPRLAQMLQTEKIPHEISNQKFNQYVKELMKKVGINQVIEIKKIIGGKRIVEYKEKWQLISSHTARRSFATNLYKQGVNPSIIMMMTGHKDLDTFMNYIILSNDDKLQVVRTLWNSEAV